MPRPRMTCKFSLSRTNVMWRNALGAAKSYRVWAEVCPWATNTHSYTHLQVVTAVSFDLWLSISKQKEGMNRPHFVFKSTNLLCFQGNVQPVWRELLYQVAEGQISSFIAICEETRHCYTSAFRQFHGSLKIWSAFPRKVMSQIQQPQTRASESVVPLWCSSGPTCCKLISCSEQVWNIPRHWHRGNGVTFQTKAKIQEKSPRLDLWDDK